MQVDQILISSKDATLSGLLTYHFFLRSPLWNGILFKIEVLYTGFYLFIIWKCGADNLETNMTLNCLEEDGYDIISRVFIDDLERKPKQFYFFFFWNTRFLALAWLQNMYSFINSYYFIVLFCVIQGYLQETELFGWAGHVVLSSSIVIAIRSLVSWDMAFHLLFIHRNCGLFISNL